MKKIPLLIAFCVFLSILFVTSSHAQFITLETENLRLIYFSNAQTYLVKHIARCFENSFELHQKLFDYTPTEKVTVLIHDFSDYGNAGASAIPTNHITLAIAPYSYVFETMPANERMNSTMNHEIVHVLVNDKASRRDKFFRTIFQGKISAKAENPISMIYSYLTNPRRYAPLWYHEGIAVFMETWMAGGYGRAQGAYDEMVFRTMVHENKPIFDLLGLESAGTRIDFQVSVNSYLYGARFMSFLALKHGPESLIKWISRTNDSKGYYASDFKKVYGTTLDEAWSQWIQWENEFQNSNLDLIKENPVTKFRPVSEKALGSISRAFYDSAHGKLYAALNYPGQVAHIAAINVNTGKIEKLKDVKGAALYYVTSLAFDESNGTLFYTTDNNNWRDIVALDIKTKKSKLLLKDERVGDLAFDKADKSIWGVRHFNGISTIVRIPFPYTEWNQVYSWTYGKDVYDLDISPDGKYLTCSLAEISGRQSLIKMDIKNLMQRDYTYETLFDFDVSIPSNFVFSPDGKFLFGSSYYTGVSNIFRYDFEKNDMEILSNSLTGLFRPIQMSDDSLIAFSYSTEGFVPVLIANTPVVNVNATNSLGNKVIKTHNVLTEWEAGKPGDIDIDARIIKTGEYNGLRNVRLASAYPIVEGYKNYAAFGIQTDFSGPLGLHNINFSATYSANDMLSQDEKLHLKAGYEFSNWNLFFKYNAADFYDLFGPTKTSRKGHLIGLKYDRSLIYDTPKTMDYSITLGRYGGLEKLPDYQNITVSYDKLLFMNAQLNYKNMRASLGAVDYEKGLKWDLTASNNYVNQKHFPRINANIDYGFSLPLNHSSIWLRSSAGNSFGERREPFANFYFGGFGNNWIDKSSAKRYRESYSFPGLELNGVGGINYAKILVEWNLPPIVFRRFGVPAFYSNWARISFFSSGISTNVDSDFYRRNVMNYGTQIDFRFIGFSTFNFTFSIGYAEAVENNNVTSEFMVSLKIL